MKTVGMYLALIGIASIILPFLNLELKILFWIDSWGETVGWAIRIGMAVIGAILFFVGMSKENAENQ